MDDERKEDPNRDRREEKRIIELPTDAQEVGEIDLREQWMSLDDDPITAGSLPVAAQAASDESDESGMQFEEDRPKKPPVPPAPKASETVTDDAYIEVPRRLLRKVGINLATSEIDTLYVGLLFAIIMVAAIVIYFKYFA